MKQISFTQAVVVIIGVTFLCTYDNFAQDSSPERCRLELSKSAACEVVVKLGGGNSSFDRNLMGFLFFEPGDRYANIVVVPCKPSGVIAFRGIRISSSTTERELEPDIVNDAGLLSGAILLRVPLACRNVASIVREIERQQMTPGMGFGSMSLPRITIVLLNAVVK